MHALSGPPAWRFSLIPRRLALVRPARLGLFPPFPIFPTRTSLHTLPQLRHANGPASPSPPRRARPGPLASGHTSNHSGALLDRELSGSTASPTCLDLSLSSASHLFTLLPFDISDLCTLTHLLFCSFFFLIFLHFSSVPCAVFFCMKCMGFKSCCFSCTYR